MVLKIERLSPEHDRSGFDCGSEALNRYLKETARQHGERGISRTFMLVEDTSARPRPILGFFTVSLCQVAGENLPPATAKRLPRALGGIKLGRLAIAKAHQRKGYGAVLLADAFKKCIEVSGQAGGIGLFVDAKDDAAKAYYGRFGFVSLSPDPLLMFLPVETIIRELKNRT